MLCGTLSNKFCNHHSWEERAICIPLFASWCYMYAACGVTCFFLAVPTDGLQCMVVVCGTSWSNSLTSYLNIFWGKENCCDHFSTGLGVIFFCMLNSTEHEIYPAHKF